MMKSEVIFVFVFNLMLVNALPAIELNRTDIKPAEINRVNDTVIKKYNENFPWDTFCTDFRVPDLTFFPHPDSCNWYFVCWNDVLINGVCDDDLVYDPKARTCVFPEDYDCVLGLYPRWTDPRCPPPESNDLVFLPSEYCDAFEICVNGWPIEVQCRPGQHWNADREYCDDPRNAGCENDNGNYPNGLPECPPTFIGSLPHPDDCNLFIHCSNGNRFIQRCPHLHHFDINTGRCMVLTQANCIDEYRGRRRN
ncbi:probable chitinase 10 [Chironomus tepperi]|uniref:probable chitinase 10 n=1 Tax=Chironomus tepperi TaxID=113505 RepID=UPI00391F8045